MEMRCKEGDLALVIHDEPGCESNIGRVVEVRGPLNVNERLELPCWLIRPVKPELWSVAQFDGIHVIDKLVGWESQVEHPDAWMLPLRPPKEETCDSEVEHEPELVIVR